MLDIFENLINRLSKDSAIVTIDNKNGELFVDYFLP